MRVLPKKISRATIKTSCTLVQKYNLTELWKGIHFSLIGKALVPDISTEHFATCQICTAILHEEWHEQHFCTARGKGPLLCCPLVDGDGGHLVGDFFPGLLDCATSHRVPCQNVQPHDLTLVPSSERHHDAPELGHVYYLELDNAAGGKQVVIKLKGY